MWKIKLQKIVGNLLDKLPRFQRSHESPLFTVESTINLTYQTVMRSCYKPGKILNENKLRLPDGRWIRKRSFPSEARSAKKKKRQACLFIICYSLLFVRSYCLQRFSGALVYKTIKWRLARFYSTQTKAMRGINRKIYLQSIITDH